MTSQLFKEKYPKEKFFAFLDKYGDKTEKFYTISKAAYKKAKLDAAIIPFFKDLGQNILPGIILSQLFYRYNILLTSGVHSANLIVINPALIVTKENIDYLINSLDDYFSNGFVGMLTSYGKMKISSAITNLYSP